MVAELNGTSCIPLQMFGKPQKQIANTRTFGEDTNKLHVLEGAISSFVAKTSHRLRLDRQLAKKAGIFIATNKHKPGYRMTVREINLPMPTADTGLITATLAETLASMFNPRDFYHRAGVWLYDFVPENALQMDLVGSVDANKHDKSTSRMQTIDSLNQHYGKHTIYYASEDLGKSWQPIRNIQMPRYTTRWDELPTINIR